MEISDIVLKHLIFFLIGIFQDIFITYYYQMISKEHAWRAGLFSTLVTLINILILYEILTGIEEQVFSVILAYAIGNGVGTLIVMKKHLIKNYFNKKP
jgi:uncharacterized protein YebE (UPF0316 family)